jgi:hypothetical protein
MTDLAVHDGPIFPFTMADLAVHDGPIFAFTMVRNSQRVLGLAPARFHAWRSLADSCGLADRASCPHTTPTQLTAEEVATIGSMVLPYIKQDEDWFVAEKAAILHDIIDGAGGHNGVMYQNSMEPLKPSSVDWTRKPCVSSSNFRR